MVHFRSLSCRRRRSASDSRASARSASASSSCGATSSMTNEAHHPAQSRHIKVYATILTHRQMSWQPEEKRTRYECAKEQAQCLICSAL